MFEGTDRESHHVKHRPACLLIMLSHPLKVILELYSTAVCQWGCFLVLQEVLICYQRDRKEIREKVTRRGREKESCLCCARDLQRLMRLCCVLTHGCLILSCALSPVFRGDKASKLL